ncbi:MAG: flippase-like domain-containing protein, partial [Bacteroidia bacterium]|nr:flippase-like domain-containing protein [Bacteroidia bacterium]
MKLKAVVQYLAALILGAGIFYLVFKDVSWADLQKRFSNVRWPWVAAGLVVGLGSHFLRGMRWRMLLSAAGHKVSSLHAFLAVMTGYMANNAVPRMGEVVRCTALTRSDKVPLTVGVATVVVERV